ASTSVASTSVCALVVPASSAAARSLSMTASTPRRVPSGSRTTGIPPPPAATTRYPAASSAPTAGASSTSNGSGEATTRRQPRAVSVRVQGFRGGRRELGGGAGGPGGGGGLGGRGGPPVGCGHRVAAQGDEDDHRRSTSG